MHELVVGIDYIVSDQVVHVATSGLYCLDLVLQIRHNSNDFTLIPGMFFESDRSATYHSKDRRNKTYCSSSFVPAHLSGG